MDASGRNVHPSRAVVFRGMGVPFLCPVSFQLRCGCDGRSWSSHPEPRAGSHELRWRSHPTRRALPTSELLSEAQMTWQ